MKISQVHTLKLLVGLSLACLFIFLTFWNTENYQRSKSELVQDLKDQMSLACSEYRDSMVQDIFQFIKLENIGTHDSSSLKFHRNIDTSHQMVSLVIKERLDGVTMNSLPKPHHADTNITVTIHAENIADEDKSFSDIILWKSHESSSVRYEYSMDTITQRTDTLITKGRFSFTGGGLPFVYKKLDTLFTDKLRNQKIFIDYQVFADSSSLSQHTRAIKIPFDYHSFGFAKKPVAVFENYNSYLLKKMSSSLLMSLILFTVVAASFYVLLKTWLRQNRLTAIKNEFVSNMTHELKTPIATIGVAIEALENFGGLNDPKKRAEYLDISKHEVNRLKILVDKVLKMSTMDKANNNLHIDNIDIKQLTENMLNSMQLHFEKNKVTLNYRHSNDDFGISGDQTHLTNVMYNLIDNAIKYSGDQPQIDVDLQTTKDHVIVKVSDKGQGIDSAYLPKIFDRFFRVPSDDKHNVKGYGLGLHYVDTVIRQHSGSIKVESEKNKGSKFTIQLPKAS